MSLDVTDQPQAKKSKSKNPMHVDLTENFDTFIQEGNVFDVRKGSRKLQKFIPNTPDDGLNSSFNADEFGINSKKTSDKLTKRFFNF